MDLIICDEQHKIDVKRVVVEAIDINWVFHGNNMKMLIILLRREKVSHFFETKAMRSFIMMIWSRYRSAIIERVFIPNLFYLISFITLAYYELDTMPNIYDMIYLSNNILSFELPFILLLMTNFAIAFYMYWIEVMMRYFPSFF